MNVRKLNADDTLQFSINEDWYTVTKIEDDDFQISRQGKGDYEKFSSGNNQAQLLVNEATSEII